MRRNLWITAVILLSVGFVAAAPAQAQRHRLSRDMERLHHACWWDWNRQACINFGVLLGRNQQRHKDWRRDHPDWWWWQGHRNRDR